MVLTSFYQPVKTGLVFTSLLIWKSVKRSSSAPDNPLIEICPTCIKTKYIFHIRYQIKRAQVTTGHVTCDIESEVNLFLDRHGETSLAPGSSVSFPPEWGDSLGLCVEKQSLFPIEVSITQERAPGPCEGHHGKRHWDGDVDSNLRSEDGVYIIHLDSRYWTTECVRPSVLLHFCYSF